MSFWGQLLDYFTKLDELLRQLIEVYKTGNQELIAAIKGEEPAPPIPVRHVPFFVEDTVVTGTPVTLLVKDDSEQGLGAVGRAGIIYNDGGGSLYVLIDDGKGKSKEIRIVANTYFGIDKSDGIQVDKVTLSCTAGTISYRCLFSVGG